MIWSAVTLALLAAPPQFDVALADGTRVRGALESLSTESAAVLVGSDRRLLATAQLVGMTPAHASESFVETAVLWVELIDGTKLSAVQYTVAAGRATIDFGSGITTSVPTAAIRSVRFKEQPEGIAKQWQTILQQTPKADLIVIREDTAIDYLEGLFGDVTPETVTFELDGDKVPVKRPKIEGLVYYHAKSESLEPAFCVVTDRAGSVLQAAATSLVDGKLRVTTPAGCELTLPLERVNAVDFPAHYLSDMKPEQVVFTPLVREPAVVATRVAERYRPRFDRALEPGPLRVGGRDYQKGIALHSKTEVTYLLPEQFVKFTATAGIDDRIRPHGGVSLVVHGDDRVLLEKNLTGEDPPLLISLDVSGVTRLKITVDFGADGIDAGDYLDLCEPRLYK